MKTKSFSRTKKSCYFAYLATASVFSMPPLLFVTFRDMYGISYTLLGLLILINFVTQLSVDLIFSFFSHKFNIEKTVKLTPALTIVGLWIYALWPLIFPICSNVIGFTVTIVFTSPILSITVMSSFSFLM